MLELNSGRLTFRIFIFFKRVLMFKCGFYTGLVLEGKHDARSRPAIFDFLSSIIASRIGVRGIISL